MRRLESIELMNDALALLGTALSLIDAADAPGEIGAYVDLARDRLCRTLESMRADDPIVVEMFPKPAA
jgi:hypothetical protein